MSPPTSTRTRSRATTGAGPTPARPSSSAISRGHRRLRASIPSSLRDDGRRGGLGREDPHLHRPTPPRRGGAQGQCRGQRPRPPQLPPVPGLARAGRVPRAEVPHLPLGARARPDRQAGGDRWDRLDGHADRSRDRTARGAGQVSFSGSPGGSSPRGTGTSRRRSDAALRSRLQTSQGADPAGSCCWSGTRSAGPSTDPGTKMNTLREHQCRSFIDREFAERPDLRKALTPKYPYPGKRPILNSTFYGCAASATTSSWSPGR